MSIADEIMELKKLLDSGILSNDEYERAKQGLLNKVSVTTNPAFRQESFVGKWRATKDETTFDFNLSANGDAKFIMSGELIKDLNVLNIAVGIGNGSGKWWIDNSQLYISVLMGNAIGRIWANREELKNRMIFELDLEAISQQEIRALWIAYSDNNERQSRLANGKGEMRLLRIGV